MSGLVFAAALAGVVIFGGSAIATKIAVSAISAIDVSIMRTVIGGLFALPLALALRIRLPGTRPQFLLLLLSGFCGFIAFPLLFTLGVSLTTANHATMILAILPVLTGAIAQFWDRQTPPAIWWLGCSIAFAGEALLLYDPAAATGSASVEGDLLVWISTVFASLGYVAGARLQRSGYSARGTTFWGVVLFAAVLLPLAPLIVDFDALAGAGAYAWSGLLYQAIGVTIIAYILWYWACTRSKGYPSLQPVRKRPVARRATAGLALASSKEHNNADDRFLAGPTGAPQIDQCGVAVLVKDRPFPADCALPWPILGALNAWISLGPSTWHRRHCARRPVPVFATGFRRAVRLVDTGGKFIVDLSAVVIDHHGRRHSRVARKVTACPLLHH